MRIASFGLNWPYFNQHLMTSSYLPKAIANYEDGQRSLVIDRLIERHLGGMVGGPALPVVPLRQGAGMFSQTSGGINVLVLSRVYEGNRTLTFQQAEIINQLVEESADDTGADFRAQLIQRNNWFVERETFFRGRFHVNIMPRQSLIDEFGLASQVPNRNAPPPAPTILQANQNDANRGVAATVMDAPTPGSWATPRVPPTPQAALAQRAIVAANTGSPAVVPQPERTAAAVPIPKQFLATTAKIGDGQYAVLIDGEAVVSFSTKSRARSHAKSYNRIVKNLREAWGFEIDNFAERLRGQLIQLSGAEGIANGMTTPLPGY